MILAFFLILSLVAGFVFNLMRQKYERIIHEKGLTNSKALMLPAKEVRRIISESNDKDMIDQLNKSLIYRRMQYVSYAIFVLSFVFYCAIKIA